MIKAKRRLRITSDGTAQGTKVYVGDIPIHMTLKSIAIQIGPTGQAEAMLVVAGPALEFEGEVEVITKKE